MSRHTGRLLVATPLIGDPHFERTVVLLLAHSADGAFGLVLNRPSAIPVYDIAPEWASQVSAPGVVFVGGPVGTEAVVGLAVRGSHDEGGFVPVVGDIGTIDLHQDPSADEPRWSGLRLYAGSAGWAPGQLEDELSEGAWWPVDAGASDITVERPDELWSAVLRRQRGEVTWYANHPKDASAN